MTLPRRLLLLIAAVLMVVAMTVVTASPVLASDLTKDPAKHETDKDKGTKGTAKYKLGKGKDLLK